MVAERRRVGAVDDLGEARSIGERRREQRKRIARHLFASLDDDPVGTDVVIGPNAARPLVLDIPLFVSDMSFGALSEEAKVSLARGAELAGTGICSGEGGMLPEEQAAMRYRIVG